MTPNIKSKYLPFLSKKRIVVWKSTCLKDCDYINLNINDTLATIMIIANKVKMLNFHSLLSEVAERV